MIKITKAGWIYIFLTLAVGFAAVNTGNNLVYILTSTLLSYMLISGIFGRRNISSLDVNIKFPEEMYADSPALVRVEIINSRRFTSAFLIQVILNNKKVFFPYVPARATVAKACELKATERGYFRLKEVYISSNFPFNFFIRYREIKQDFVTIVYPKPKGCLFPPAVYQRSYGKEEHQALGEGGRGELLSIRNYIEGDALRDIHWKSTAKTDQLKTKEFSREDSPDVIIYFNSIAGADIEEKLSCATYLIIRMYRANIPVGLAIDNRVFKPALSPLHKHTLLRILALYGKG